MDATRFDRLVKSLSAGGTRRGVLLLLAGLPLGGMLTFLFGDEPAEAKRRKKRHQKRNQRKPSKQRVGGESQPHKPHCRHVKGKGHGHHGRRKNCQAHHGGNGNGKGKDKPKPCTPEPLAQTCDGQCGTIKNNCQETVDCGSCACEPACSACQTCDAASGQCQADPEQDGQTCGGCQVCNNGQCVVDATIVCEPLDQCHEAGVCDPQTGECTNPNKADGTACDDGDPCTTNDACQNGACRGTLKDCSAEDDACNDGVCRADGTCIKRPKPNGTSCNADNDSCTSGDSCQQGVCTPGAGVDCRAQDDPCNRGVCRQSDGACIKDPRPDGTPCGENGQCHAGVCEEVACLALGEACDAGDNQCCDADCAPSEQFFCNESGDLCCHQPQGSCSGACDCCGPSICENDKCCHFTGDTCQSAADCCQDFFNHQGCVAGRCCALPDEPCEAEGDCCEGLCHPEGFCTGCLGLQQPCDDQGQCCQSGGLTHCAAACDFDIASCCRPPGGSCGEQCDCCDQTTCCNNVCCDVGEECVNGTCRPICRQHGQNCIDAPDACCSGFECRSANFETVCRPAICFEFLETCTGEARPCCTGECTTVVFGAVKACCSPEGQECDDLGIFFPGGHCCGTNVCNGANQCARCRQPGETCDGNEVSSNCCNALDNPPEACLSCQAGVCAPCAG